MDHWTRSSKTFGAAASLTLALGLAGCASEDGEPTTAATDGDTDVDTRVSYYEDVRPVLNERCVACHVPGSVAPFPLGSYEAAAEVGPLIRAVV